MPDEAPRVRRISDPPSVSAAPGGRSIVHQRLAHLAELADGGGQPLGKRCPEPERHVRVLVEHARDQLAVDFEHLGRHDRRRRRRPAGIDEKRESRRSGCRSRRSRRPGGRRLRQPLARCRRRRRYSPRAPPRFAEKDLAGRQLQADRAEGKQAQLLGLELAEQGDPREQGDVAVETHDLIKGAPAGAPRLFIRSRSRLKALHASSFDPDRA